MLSRLKTGITRAANYTLSIPERLLRSLAALLGGTTVLVTDALFPEALRQSTLYKVMVGNAQQFLVGKIGQVDTGQPVEPDDPAAGDDFVQRKLVGNALEAAGLLAMSFSPLWVFAIAGDAAAGSKAFLQRLAEHLKANQLIAPDANLNNLTDLLDALQTVSRRTATAIDTPPLNRAQLEQLASDLRQNYAAMFGKGAALLPRFDELWLRMEGLVRAQSVSLEEIGGMMALNAARLPQKSWKTIRAVGSVSSELFGEKVLASYAKTLDGINRQGVNGYVSRHMQPFVQRAVRHFAPAQVTATESWLERQRSGKAKTPGNR